MKERPILFSGPMVRAILQGRKTQTRRAMKDQPGEITPAGRPLFFANGEAGRRVHPKCPYGKIGDRLWVRETHAIVPRTAYSLSDGVEQVLRPDDNHDAAVFREGWSRCNPGKWRPSIHMPRWASRIALEITDIRVERLNDIREADAKAEGIMEYKGPLRWVRYLDAVTGEANFNCARDAFVSLWESISGAGSWAANPWVWVIEFKRVAP